MCPGQPASAAASLGRALSVLLTPTLASRARLPCPPPRLAPSDAGPVRTAPTSWSSLSPAPPAFSPNRKSRPRGEEVFDRSLVKEDRSPRGPGHCPPSEAVLHDEDPPVRSSWTRPGRHPAGSHRFLVLLLNNFHRPSPLPGDRRLGREVAGAEITKRGAGAQIRHGTRGRRADGHRGPGSPPRF